MLIDIGVETYSRKTFSPERYDIWTMQSAYHNVLTFGEEMQQAGEDFHAEEVKTFFNEDSSIIEMELAGCYPAGTITSYQRKVELIKNSGIKLTDRFTPYTEKTFLSLMTSEKPVWNRNILRIGGIETLHFEGIAKAEIEEIKITDIKLKREWGENLYRTKLYPSGGEITFTSG